MSWLNSFFFDTLAYPWVLVFLVAVAVLLVAELFARAPGVLSISTGEALGRMPLTPRAWLRRVPAVLRGLGLAALVVALAGPLNGFQIRKDRVSVVDIMLCVDVSGSMQQKDFVMGGEYKDRLFVTKAAVRDFIESRKEKVGDRFGLDRLGLVLYAGFAWTQSPLTLDYGVLSRELDLAYVDDTSRDPRKDGTAIGSAIGLAIRRLSESEAKSKVIILLTDGINNRGELDPITAARLAADYDIKVYTIGAGSTEGGRSSGGFFSRPRQPIDEDGLRKIASITGGQYYPATDTEALQQAYAEIDALETTEIEVGDYYEYKEAFVPYVLLGGLLMALSIFSRRMWFEVIP